MPARTGIDQRFYAIITNITGTPSELTNPDGMSRPSALRASGAALSGATAEREHRFAFPGQYADPETGLHYNQQRYYDPVSGSYLTPDPLGLAPSANPHAYVSNPEVLTDPPRAHVLHAWKPARTGQSRQGQGRNIVYRALNSQDARRWRGVRGSRRRTRRVSGRLSSTL